jgi:RHS repeat-associated protein
MGGVAAARLGDPIAHISIWARLARVALRVATGMLEAVAVGALIVGGAFLMGTPVGWCAAIFAGGLIAGFVGSLTGWSDMKEKWIKDVTENIGEGTVTGAIAPPCALTVLINSLPAARAVLDTGICSKDSGPPIPVAEGSETVFIETGPAARQGDKLVCQAKIKQGSRNVFIGGGKVQYLEMADDKEWWETGLEIAIGLVMARGSFGSWGGIKCLAGGFLANMAASWAGGKLRSWLGWPVLPTTGSKILNGDTDTDFALSGAMPIVWRRRYNSVDQRNTGMFGSGWTMPYEIELRVVREVDSSSVVFVDDAGRETEMPDLEPGNGMYNTAEAFALHRTPGGHYEVKTLDGVLSQFGSAPEQIGTHRLQLKRQTDRNGNWIAFRYDAFARMINIADSCGRLLRLVYDGESRRVSAVWLERGAGDEQVGRLVGYTYDAAGMLAGVVDRSGKATRDFAYYEGLMISQSFGGEFTTYYAWEAIGAGTGPRGARRVVKHWTSDDESYNFTYIANSDGTGETLAFDQLGRKHRWTWDAKYNATSYTNPLQESWQLEWNGDGNLTSLKGPAGETASYAYNDMGWLSAQTNPIGQSVKTVWHPQFAEPLALTYSDGSKYLYQYDEKGNLLSETDPTGNATEYSYDGKGLIVSITDAKGGTKNVGWNDIAQATSYTDCSAKTTRFEYDGYGFLNATIDALGQVTRYVHDAMGRLQSVNQADGAATSYSYDAAGRLIGAIDPLSRTTGFSLNERGQLIKRTDTAGRAVALTYDAAHRLQTLINENGERYEFLYDAADQLIEERRVDGTRVLVEYNESGQPIAVTHVPSLGDDAVETESGAGTSVGSKPIRTELVRDAVGRLLEKRTPTLRYTYEYDAMNRLLEAKKIAITAPLDDAAEPTPKPLHTTKFKYDKIGQLVAETAIDEVTGESHTLQHSHDPLGNRTQTALPDLAALPNTKRALNYLYYGSGHLHQINLSHASPETTNDARGNAEAIHQLICDIERDDLHREVERTQGGVITRYAHDAMGRRTGAWTQASALRGAAFKTSDLAWRNALAQTLGSVADGASDVPVSAKASAGAGASALNGLMKEYRYDLVGELRTSLSTLNGQIHHRYDATGRVEETHRLSRGANTVAHSSERFGYDPAGNILDPKIASKLAEASQSRQQRGYVRDNRVRVFEDKRFAYDGHGRLIEKKTAKHTVQRFEWDDEHRLTAVHTTRHANDAKKRLTQSTRFDYDAIGRRVAKHDAFGTTRFIWEGMRLIEERRGAHVVSYVYEPGSYVPLARIDASGDTTQQGGIATEQEAKNTDYIQAPRFTAPSDWASTTNQTVVNAASNYLSSPDSLGRSSKELNQETLPSVRHSREGGNPDRRDTLIAANDGSAAAWEALLPPANLDTKQASGNETNLANVYYFHTDQVGLPEELSDNSGNIRWRASYKTWGATVSESWDAVSLNGEPLNPLIANAPAYASEAERLRAESRVKATNAQTDRDEQIKAEALEQNLRFQGQYLDRDTGLHYNTFRYYDADIGRFISPDPIGLDGGHNLASYGINPVANADPLGWDWNYYLTDANGNIYYHGRASDNQSLADVMARHSKNVGQDGLPRMGKGDVINRTTPVGTSKDIVRGIENNGTRTDGKLGRGGTSVRGNVDHGISDAKLKTSVGQGRVAAADAHLKASGANSARDLKPIASRTHSGSKTGC